MYRTICVTRLGVTLLFCCSLLISCLVPRTTSEAIPDFPECCPVYLFNGVFLSCEFSFSKISHQCRFREDVRDIGIFNPALSDVVC